MAHPLTGNFVHKDVPCTAKKIPKKAVFITSRQSCPTAKEHGIKTIVAQVASTTAKGIPGKTKDLLI